MAASSRATRATIATFIAFAVLMSTAVATPAVTARQYWTPPSIVTAANETSTSLIVPPPETINDLAQYIVAQIYRANQLAPQDRQGVTPTPILLGGQTCVLCTLVSDLVLGLGSFLGASLQGVYRLVGVPFLNLAVTLLSPVIVVARILINFSSIVTGMFARAFQPLYGGNGDPNQLAGTYWGVTNALAYAMLYWPVSVLMEQAVIPFFTG